MLLAQLLETTPWKQYSNTDGKLLNYDGQKWIEVNTGESFKVTKYEGQVCKN